MLFYVGTHMVNHAKHLQFAMVSVNRLLNRRSDFEANDWIMDSGAFTNILTRGEHMPLEQYAEQIERWYRCGSMNAAVTQDFMCEPFILGKTGKTVFQHQAMTIERFVLLRDGVRCVYILPVLRGYQPQEYVDHVRHCGRLLRHGAWVGVGSVCKRNTDIRQIRRVLGAIKKERPDLKLHGFGLKTTAFTDGFIRACLWSCDSMAWSYAARKQGRNANGLSEAIEFAGIVNRPYQADLFSKMCMRQRG